MPVISLEVNVPEFTEEELREAILEACVNRVLGTGWDEEEEPAKVKAQSSWFIEELRKTVRETTLQRVQAVVERAVEPLVQALLDRPFTRVDRWGNEERSPTTLREMIVRYGSAYLTEKVHPNGNTVTDSYNRDGKPTRLAHTVQSMVEDVYRKELSLMVNKAAAEVKTELAGKVTATVTEAVRGLLNLEKGR